MNLSIYTIYMYRNTSCYYFCMEKNNLFLFPFSSRFLQRFCNYLTYFRYVGFFVVSAGDNTGLMRRERTSYKNCYLFFRHVPVASLTLPPFSSFPLSLSIFILRKWPGREQHIGMLIIISGSRVPVTYARNFSSRLLKNLSYVFAPHYMSYDGRRNTSSFFSFPPPPPSTFSLFFTLVHSLLSFLQLKSLGWKRQAFLGHHFESFVMP